MKIRGQRTIYITYEVDNCRSKVSLFGSRSPMYSRAVSLLASLPEAVIYEPKTLSVSRSVYVPVKDSGL